ncbi:MAG: cadmium-translocating P-type ATPase [Bacteroidetes bacterium]|nr:cadmium-translocating P-type ATPase [Bacteroidota bacterium]
MQKTVTIPVQGMTCSSCVTRIEKKVSRLQGVSQVSVNLAGETATVSFQDDLIGYSAIRETIRKSGYEVPESQSRQVSVAISGMTCANCVSRIEKKTGKLTGVLSATVNLGTETGLFTFDPEQITEQDILATIIKAGYSGQITGAESVNSSKETQDQKELTNLILALVFSAPFLILMADMVVMAVRNGNHLLPHLFHTGWFQLILSLPVQFWFGRQFHLNAWHAIRQLSPDMNVLVSLGSWASFGLSLWTLLSGGTHFYFESGVLVISFVLTGKYLERRAKRKSGEAIRALLKLTPETCRVLENGVEIPVPVSAVLPGQVIRIRPGENFPIDGKILDGQSTADESLLTGESVPVEKTPGNPVYSGTVNLTGLVSVRVEKTGKDTVLSGIIRLVEQAQAGKPAAQILADRISAVFVPVVILIAGFVFLLWFSLITPGSFTPAILAMVSVLVIACPCALGLATPVSVLVASGEAALSGILFRSGSSLQSLSETTVFILDKTGTLTSGSLSVLKIDPEKGYSEAKVLQLASSLAFHSTHPVSEAVIRKAEEINMSFEPAEKVLHLTGSGLSGTVMGTEILAGRPGFAWPGIEHSVSSENPVLFVSENGVPAGSIEFSDPVRPGSSELVRFLQDRNVKVILLSGDREEVVKKVARETGIKIWSAQNSPADKAGFVKEQILKGGKVAFAGDGINDAAALSQSDTGIAMGWGSDVAIQAGDVTLLSSTPSAIIRAWEISRLTRENIRQNFWWAFLYNVIGIPAAAAGILTPWIAGTAMSLSSVSVVLNAIRLKSRIRKSA